MPFCLSKLSLRSRTRQLISVKDWGDCGGSHDRSADFVLFLFSMHNVIIYFLFYGEENKCRGGMQTGWRGTWHRTIVCSTLLGRKWQPCLLFGRFVCFRLAWFSMECKGEQYLAISILFRKKLFRFLCSLENDSVRLGKTSHNNALREISWAKTSYFYAE